MFRCIIAALLLMPGGVFGMPGYATGNFPASEGFGGGWEWWELIALAIPAYYLLSLLLNTLGMDGGEVMVWLGCAVLLLAALFIAAQLIAVAVLLWPVVVIAVGWRLLKKSKGGER